MYTSFFFIAATDQHLDLSKSSADDIDPVKGQIIVSLMSRDGPSGSGNPLAIVGPGGDILGPDDERDITNSIHATSEPPVRKYTSFHPFVLFEN